MFEFFFCPQHGLLRPEMLAWGVAYAGNLYMEAQFWYIRFVQFFGRFL